jgi:hypothetical protein
VNDSATPCFAHHHLKPAEYGLLHLCRTLAGKSGILYFDGRKMAARFSGVSKDTVYRTAKSLVEKGWLEVMKSSRRRDDGTMSPTHYRVLSHEEWAVSHPDQCGQPVSPARLDLSQNAVAPVSK